MTSRRARSISSSSALSQRPVLSARATHGPRERGRRGRQRRGTRRRGRSGGTTTAASAASRASSAASTTARSGSSSAGAMTSTPCSRRGDRRGPHERHSPRCPVAGERGARSGTAASPSRRSAAVALPAVRGSLDRCDDATDDLRLAGVVAARRHRAPRLAPSGRRSSRSATSTRGRRQRCARPEGDCGRPPVGGSRGAGQVVDERAELGGRARVSARGELGECPHAHLRIRVVAQPGGARSTMPATRRRRAGRGRGARRVRRRSGEAREPLRRPRRCRRGRRRAGRRRISSASARVYDRYTPTAITVQITPSRDRTRSPRRSRGRARSGRAGGRR